MTMAFPDLDAEATNPLLTMTSWQAAQRYDISISTAQKWIQRARRDAGLPTRGELRTAARLDRGPVGTARGYEQIRRPKEAVAGVES